MNILKDLVYKSLTQQQLMDISKQTKEVLYDIDSQIIRYDLLDCVMILFINKNQIDEMKYFINNIKITKTLYEFNIKYGVINFSYIVNGKNDLVYKINNIKIQYFINEKKINKIVYNSKNNLIVAFNEIRTELANNNFSYITYKDVLILFCYYANDYVESVFIDLIEGKFDGYNFVENNIQKI